MKKIPCSSGGGMPALKKLRLIMRLNLFLLLISVFPVAAGVNAQNVKLNLKMTKATIAEVFDAIEQKSDVYFFYNKEEVDDTQLVDVDFKNKTLDEVLEYLERNLSISYQLAGKNVIIKPQAGEFSGQQKRKITGKVTESSGQPLPGVTVLVKGTTQGTISDFDGNYTIENVPTDAVLAFSFVGMRTQEVVVGTQSTINVIMAEDAIGIEEVVAVGYGTQKKTNLTGAVQSVSASELKDRPVVSAVSSLQGAIPNLNVYVSDGKANSVPTLNIRGTTTLSGGGEPLIVIDGVPATVTEFSQMNPSDIESVSSLMDAASAAIYGARAAFGVVLVTTKSAGKEEVQVSYNTNISMRRPVIIPEFIRDQNTVMRARVTATGGWYTLKDIYGINDWDFLDRVTAGEEDEVVLNPEDPTRWLTAGRTDWYEEAMKNYSMTQNHNVAISGRNDKTSYYFSGGYSRQDGIFRYGNDIFDKYNMRGKIDFDVTDWLNISNNTSYNYDVYDEPSQGFNFSGLYNTSTLGVIKNPDGSWSSAGAELFGAASEGGRSYTRNARYWTSFTGKASLIKDMLTVTAKASFMRSNKTRKVFWLPIEYKIGPDEIRTKHPVKDAQRDAGTARQNVFDLYADFDKSFRKHHVHVLVGYNQEYRYDDWFKAYRKDLISSSVPSINNATGDKELDEWISDWATRSGFFRLNYDYDGKYLFEMNGRYDGTSRFPEEDRFVFVPSASLGWNIHKENFFMPFSSIINTLKPRISYGRLGNQNVSAYHYIAKMNDGKTSSILDGGEYDQQLTLYAPGLVSGNLTWEKVETKNIGIDFGLLNNRLSGTFDYYHRATIDMLTKGKKLPGVLGTAVPDENAADLITKGWELTLAWKDNFKLGSDRLNYNARFTLADSRAWITDFDNPEGRLNDYYVGYEIGTIWGYEVNGLFQSEEEIANHANQSAFWTYPGKVPPAPGDMKFEDLNGDGEIRGGQTIYDLKDLKKIGNSSARYHTSLRIGADWKGFDFSAFAQGVLKQDWYPTSYYFWGLNAGPWTNLQTWQHENSWTPDNTEAYLPRLKGYAATWWSGGEMIRQNTRYLQNNAYIRLKNVTMGYSIPSSLIQRINVAQLRLFVAGENLFTWSGIKNPNIDPEASNSNYPIQKMFTCGLSVKF